MQPPDAHHPMPEELTAYADGEASADVVAHVGGCATCTESAAGYAHTAELLRGSLYRFDCPTPHTLGEYQLDLLDAVERTTVAAHATGCGECLAELQTLRAFLAAPAPVPVSVGERVRRVVASLFAPAPGLAYGGLRGDLQTATRVFEAGDVAISVGSGQGVGSVIGLVVINAAGSETLAGREARLLRPGGSVLTTVVDDLGNFEFSDIPAGSYTLELDLADRIVLVEGLQVN